MFAIVTVNTPAHSGGSAYQRVPQAGERTTFPGPVFHYHVPPERAEQIKPGTLIEVPFGPRQVQGIVIALSDATPVSETKPLTQVLIDRPVLSQSQLDLGLWLSAYYLSPLIDCLRLMLPPGLLRQPRAVLSLHPEVPIPSELPSAQRQVIELIEQRGTLSATQIARRVGKAQARKAIRALVRRGILVRGSELPAPRARPKRVNLVRLRASPSQVEEMRPLLGRPNKQASVLQALLDQDDPLPSVDRIMALANVSQSTLATLAGKGWIELTPKRTLILALPAAEDADLGRAPRQKAVLDYLCAQAVPVEERAVRQATGASTATLRALQERGLIRQIPEPSAVLLCLDEAEARRTIIRLRGARQQHRVLDYLLSRSPGEWTWVSWVYAETGCTRSDLLILEEHSLVDLAEREVWRDPLADRSFAPERPPLLTPDQERAWAEIKDTLAERGQPDTFLLYGVTGSGKTEIYMRAVEMTLRQGRQAIVLVPEISLTPQTIRRFAARSSDGLGVIHSGLSDGERYDTWRRIRTGQIRLVIGPRSALFAPFDDIGLIVLDEEHDASYKQSDTMPAYHARKVALQIAKYHSAVVLLGSATPDIVTFYRARETDDIHLLKLPQRIQSRPLHTTGQPPTDAQHREMHVTQRLPPVRVVDMRHELRVGNRSIFSRALQEGVKRALASGEQVILFLNRRGASTFVMCRDCGTAVRCPRCDIPLTYHLGQKAQAHTLTCHHCNYKQEMPRVCPICQSARIKYFGAGTQRVEETLCALLPDVRVLRWDSDTTTQKGSHQALLDRFMKHQADVLIGTQMIAKGLDLPLVTLVGVISADTALNLPDFRAAERTFQLLTQVAGRAGRGPRGGQVIIQTYTPEHYAIRAAANHDYEAFYKRERAFRHQLGYPPFSRLARLLYSDSSATRCREQAAALAETLRDAIQRHHIQHVHLIGPAPCFLNRLQGRWRWQIIIRADAPHDLLKHVSLPPVWRLDIDPLDVL
jgi:primosomal protein N' (replication factor Y)